MQPENETVVTTEETPAEGAGVTTPAEGEGGGAEEAPPALTQADIDNAVEAAKAKWEAEKAKAITAATTDALTEAEKLSKMTADQKAEYTRQQKEADLVRREAEITRNELKQSAMVTLGDKDLPIGLADILVYESAEKCNASIDTVEKVFKAAVDAAVNVRLRGSAPKVSTTTAPKGFRDQYLAATKAGNTLQAIEIKRKAFEAGEIIN